MKPTMPMNAFPPGGPPGTPPGGGGYPPPGGGGSGWGLPPGGGGGWGPPGGTPPPGGGYMPPPQPAPKGKTGLYVGGGCGCLLLSACIVAGVLFAIDGMGSLSGPGEEVASTAITPGQPFTLTYVQDGDQKYEAWLEVDVAYTAGYSLSGPVRLLENGTAFGQYTLAEDGDGHPVPERAERGDDERRRGWNMGSATGTSNAEGKVRLFPLPARAAGAQVTLSGTIAANPGTTGTLRLFVTERD